MQKKSQMCRFVKRMDEEWPPRFQEVAATLWDVVGKFKKTADEAQAALLGAIQLRNEVVEVNKALLEEKEHLVREKSFLQKEKEGVERELVIRTKFAHVIANTLQFRVKNEVKEKKLLLAVILCMLTVMFPFMVGVVMKT